MVVTRVTPSWSSKYRWIGLTLACCGAIFSSLAQAGPAQANCASYGLFFDGFFSDNDPVGAATHITDRQIFLCGASTSDASAWVMLAGNQGNEYAQVGFGRSDGQGERTFSEWHGTVSNWAREYHFGVFSAGTDHAYKVRYSESKQAMQMLIGSDVVDKTPFDPKSNWHRPWTGQFLGETHWTGDDVPGTPGHRTDFDQAKTQSCETCDFNAPDNVTAGTAIQAYKFNWINHPTHSQIWTDR